MNRYAKINHALLAFSVVGLAVGVLAPMITFEQFWIFNDTYSLLMGTINLLTSGNYFLFLVIFSFSILFPIFKIYLLYSAFLARNKSEEHRKRIKLLSKFGKWSMLDVFVVAFLVMTIQIGKMGEVQVHLGIYAFATAVVTSMIATHRIERSLDD